MTFSPLETVDVEATAVARLRTNAGESRSLLSVCGTRISPHALWIFRVLRSLARLISLFQHVFRPLACHVLGGEIGGGREEPGPHHAHLLAL